ncbi:CheR family methyltransferase [Flagellimonas algicola]|uniref:Protein-glutamate O-methyltransferase CheR n=1 Tax=Flagellimonas algicola TaxID=2583815 RepID=A0ABY2WL42_9FLAO|nr:protein-glutamate O-methyltransferase CheR [Allomuricauda algicola]TMU55568.1 protein-glutamate O-methyltransferase CheR [Allomuricauda algicola]
MEALLEISENELDDFIQLSDKLYGIDFSGYALESLRRRVLRLMQLKSCDSFTAFKYYLANQQLSDEELLNEISVNTTEMFRDFEVFKFLKDEVFSVLETYPRINIWHAGCSTGQEPLSLAILLKEHGLLRRTVQYCTDINSEVLAQAKKGIYELKEMKDYSANYIRSGGAMSLSDYYVANYGKAKMNRELGKNMVFTKHNLINGTSFNQMHMIMCRNVFIYLTTAQQNKVLRLFIDSLVPRGYLILGVKESAVFSTVLNELEIVNGKLKIYRKKR